MILSAPFTIRRFNFAMFSNGFFCVVGNAPAKSSMAVKIRNQKDSQINIELNTRNCLMSAFLLRPTTSFIAAANFMIILLIVFIFMSTRIIRSLILLLISWVLCLQLLEFSNRQSLCLIDSLKQDENSLFFCRILQNR